MTRQLKQLPLELRRLLAALRDRLRKVLGEDLIGLYPFGSIAFPGFEPHDVDIDFYAILRKPLSGRAKKKVEDVQDLLAEDHRHGGLLDGLFVTLDQARRREPPMNLLSGVRDDAWALHREHFRQGAYVRLLGPNPGEIVSPSSWLEVRADLDEQLKYVRKHLVRAPMYCVLNLCRLIYSWEMRRVAVSKVAAAYWAQRNLPSTWTPLIKTALRAYKDRATAEDQRFLRENAKRFYEYAARRILAAGKKLEDAGLEGIVKERRKNPAPSIPHAELKRRLRAK